MILSDDDVKERMESPLNLLNRLRTTVNRASVQNPTQHPSLPPSADALIENLEDKLKGSTRSKAAAILHSAMDELTSRMHEVQKPERLATIATEMSKILANQEDKNGKNVTNSQIIIYAPQIQSLDNFEIIDVVE